MTDFKSITDVLVTKGKVRGRPVAISLFEGAVPGGYDPVQDTPCAIVRHAMDEGKRVYFDAEHQDCLVGAHHSSIIPGKREIVSGEYLSKTSTFFSYEGAARLKSGSYVLPPGMVRAIGASPLDEVPDGVPVDWAVVVCTPHNANNIASCRTVREGILPHAEIATSLCGVLFATPWHVQNVVFATGDFGGRMHNRIKQDQVFVIIPTRFFDYLPNILNDMRVDVKATRQMTKPAHSGFWKGGCGKQVQKTATPPAEDQAAKEVAFTMEWEDEAKELMKKVPGGIREMAIGNAEEFAREKGYPAVSGKAINELMESLGMNLDDML